MSDKRVTFFTRRQFLLTSAAAGIGLSLPIIWERRKVVAQLPPTASLFSSPVLNPASILQFVDPLPVPGANWPVIGAGSETIKLVEQTVQILPTGSPLTKVWCYRGSTEYSGTYLGPTMVANSNVSNTVTYDYRGIRATTHLLRQGVNCDPNLSIIDKHVHGTEMGEPEVRFIAHLHGSKGVGPGSDGYAESWVTPGGLQNSPIPGPSVVPPQGAPGPGSHLHTYENKQAASLAWYHDHALGITRLNVYAGGAGAYLITDSVEAGYIRRGFLPQLGGPFDIPLVIQDRMFYTDGRLAYPDLDANTAGLIATPGCANTWQSGDVSTRPEFFGDVIIVNGKAWPYLEVDPAIYRFRFLNGCNSRVLSLFFSQGGVDLPIISIIGTEGGFLPSKSIPATKLLMGGAERLDVLVDFTGYAGKKLTLKNRGAKKPFPAGTPPVAGIDALVMQVRVRKTPTLVPQIKELYTRRWNPVDPPNKNDAITTRRVLLYEGRDSYGRIQPLLGSITPSTGNSSGPFTAQPKVWDDPVTETPRAGTIEIWEVFNTTADAHPIHIHEVLFSVWQRELISYKKKEGVAVQAQCPPFTQPFPSISLVGNPRPGEAFEQGYKDTALCLPGEVTRLVVDFRNSQPGRFVWHCHILEHEDHEMMRPYDVI